jgi:hypothetical protein
MRKILILSIVVLAVGISAAIANSNILHREEVVDNKIMSIDKEETSSEVITTVDYGDNIVKTILKKDEQKVYTYILNKKEFEPHEYLDLNNYTFVDVKEYSNLEVITEDPAK